jgi:lipoate-protein ligase A
VTEPFDGAANMAVDEALLRGRIAGSGPPTVRLYGWAPPTVSLGYGQPLDGAIDLAACARLGIGLVRRPTGGSAILHEGPAAELTYSVVARAGDFAGAEDLLETYRVLGTALARGLARLGVAAEIVPRVKAPATTPAFCFGRAGSYELAVAGRKLCGSAQRRQGGAFLQHGALLLDADPDRLRAVFPAVADPRAAVTTLAAVLGRRVPFADVAAVLATGFAEVLGPLARAPLSAAESAAAARLAAEKYGRAAWTRGEVAQPAHA